MEIPRPCADNNQRNNNNAHKNMTHITMTTTLDLTRLTPILTNIPMLVNQRMTKHMINVLFIGSTIYTSTIHNTMTLTLTIRTTNTTNEP